jgi:hypothetical protein
MIADSVKKLGEERSARRRRREMTNKSGERMSVVQEGEGGRESAGSIKDLVMNLRRWENEKMVKRNDCEEQESRESSVRRVRFN